MAEPTRGALGSTTADTARCYPALLRAGIAQALAYRGQIAVWVLTSLFPLVMLAAWLAVVAEVGPTAGWDRSDFVSYYVASAVVFHVTSSFLVWRWDDDVRTGALSAKLLQPVAPYHRFLAQEAGFRLVTAAALVPVVVVAAVLLPDVRYPVGPGGLVLVALALLGGFLLAALTSLVFAILGFWTTQAGNAYGLWWGAGAFLSGFVAPLELFPEPLRAAAQVLPFRSSVGFPLELLLGRLDAAEVAVGFGVTVGWCLACLVLCRAMWRAGLRRYQAVGG